MFRHHESGGAPDASMSRRVLTALVIAAALVASACQFLDSDESFEIPDDYATSDTAYTLLYSTIGYDAGATKHVLVRQNDTDAPPAQGLAFQWRLVDDGGKVVETGLAQYAGTGWSIPIWVADFSAMRGEGVYRMTLEATNVAARHGCVSCGRLSALAQDIPADRARCGGRAQRAYRMDNGYFEPNSMEGTSFAHAEFMLGMLVLYEERRAR